MESVQPHQPVPERLHDVLTEDVMAFAVGLERAFGHRNRKLSAERILISIHVPFLPQLLIR